MEKTEGRCLSILTYMELLQAAQDKKQHSYIKDFILGLGFVVLPLSENVGHRASIYIEEYSLNSGLRAGDAIIAATAVENNMMLVTGNAKHFKPIKDLKTIIFRP